MKIRQNVTILLDVSFTSKGTAAKKKEKYYEVKNRFLPLSSSARGCSYRCYPRRRGGAKNWDCKIGFGLFLDFHPYDFIYILAFIAHSDKFGCVFFCVFLEILLCSPKIALCPLFFEKIVRWVFIYNFVYIVHSAWLMVFICLLESF